ncbi:MAG: hypothetical protein M1834_006514 [Cirrosporium novae-zelandiae]|nr:MAG: hypothetical protein M1834_006514 [Cirrosporium novae-zelandiae]
MSVTCVVLGLEETHVALRDKPDLGLRVGHFLANTLRCPFIRRSYKYTKLDNNDDQLDPSISSFDLEDHPRVSVQVQPTSQKPPRAKLPFRRIFTSNVLLTLTVYAIQALHIRTFNSLWFIFLSTSRFNPSHPTPPHYHPRPPFIFTGGLGLPPARVGLAMSILGVIGITLQLFLYPRLSHRLGTLRSYRLFVPFSGLAYILVPFLALVPSTTPPPSPASGALVWLALASILFVQVLALRIQACWVRFMELDKQHLVRQGPWDH